MERSILRWKLSWNKEYTILGHMFNHRDKSSSHLGKLRFLRTWSSVFAVSTIHFSIFNWTIWSFHSQKASGAGLQLPATRLNHLFGTHLIVFTVSGVVTLEFYTLIYLPAPAKMGKLVYNRTQDGLILCKDRFVVTYFRQQSWFFHKSCVFFATLILI